MNIGLRELSIFASHSSSWPSQGRFIFENSEELKHKFPKIYETKTKLRREPPDNPAIQLFWVDIQREWEPDLEDVHSHVQCSIIHNSQDMKSESSVHLQEKKAIWWLRTHNRILFSHEKERSLAMCSNLDGPWRHYATWNELNREKQVLYNLTYM